MLLGTLKTDEFFAGDTGMNPHFGRGCNRWGLVRITGGRVERELVLPEIDSALAQACDLGLLSGHHRQKQTDLNDHKSSTSRADLARDTQTMTCSRCSTSDSTKSR